ncbi:hypothetical protein CLAIMM_08577 [Cladophialophora immunda]|nr:hypothetical protein CLAIMM_08577 [Cladophialophora immunda]
MNCSRPPAQANGHGADQTTDGSRETTPLLGRRMSGAEEIVSRATKFVVMVGFMSFFADFTYEGSRSLLGQYLPLLGASPLAISVIAGFGEFLGYALRLVSGRSADRTGLYWPITIAGYVLQMSVVPLLALARSWQVAGILVILERVGKATRNPPRDAMLSHAAKTIGFGWAFGLHEALDQFGALFGPLFAALLLKLSHQHYRFAFATLGAPAGMMLFGLTITRLIYPRPQDLEPNPSSSPATDNLSRVFWVYLAASALVAAGFADFPIIAYNLHNTGGFSDELVPVVYAVSMAVAGAGSLVLGRLFDRVGLVLLVPLTVVAAGYAPLVFLGRGLVPGIAGCCLWGLGMGVHESIIPAAVGPMVEPGRRASAYGLFTAVYGISWFVGSTIVGILYVRWMPAIVIFSVGLQLGAIPLIWYARQLVNQVEVASSE